jgi:hypothetical protein
MSFSSVSARNAASLSVRAWEANRSQNCICNRGVARHSGVHIVEAGETTGELLRPNDLARQWYVPELKLSAGERMY